MVKKIGIVLGVVLSLALVLFVFRPKSGAKGEQGVSNLREQPSAGKKATSVADKAAGKKLRRGKEGRLDKRRSPQAKKVRPVLSQLYAEEESKLSAEYRKVLADLQEALDHDDRKKLVKIVHRLQSSEEWPDGIPNVLHKSAIDALKWFGEKCAPEIMGYLGVADEEIVADALDAMLETLGDWSLSDVERASLLSNYVKVVTDEDSLGMMLDELNNMRPTVRAEAGLDIWDSGNKVALDLLKENLEFYFDADDYEVNSRDTLEQYLKDAEQKYKEDPDLAADDEEFYGGDKE